jgi:flagellar biosynthesis anti-sigma factor FlgM
MSTKPVNNNGIPTPSLIAPKAADTSKATDIKAPAANIAGAGIMNKGPGDKASNVNISDGAKSRAEAYQKALDIAKGTPDIREDRVASIKQQIKDGTYQIDSGKIADGMLREAVKDHLAETDER